jgi:hypothetical protein
MKTTAKRQSSENPFYGKKALLTLFQQAHKYNTFEKSSYNNLASLLTAAYAEVKTTEDRQLFLAIVFSIGDVNNREHNILLQRFKQDKIDNGGNGARYAFIHALNWLLSYNRETANLFYKSLKLIVEYTNFENLFVSQVRTDRKKGTLLAEVKVNADINKVAKYLAQVIKSAKTTDVQHMQLAKFLATPRLSKRRRYVEVTEKNKKRFADATLGTKVLVKKELKPHTLNALSTRYEFTVALSAELNWEVIKYPSNTRFVGLEAYKAQWNKNTEAVMFATKSILGFTKDQFIDWLNKLSSDARYRVQRRLFNKDKAGKMVTTGKWIASWGDLADAYTAWEKGKETAQEVLRSITPDQKKNMTQGELKQFEKAAKVNVGSTKVLDLVGEFFKGGADRDINIKAQSVLDKIKLDVPVLVIADISGSMSSASVVHNAVRMTATQVASYATTTFLLKNPDESLSNMFIRFENSADIVTDGSKGVEKQNRFMSGREVKIEKLIDKQEDFLTNYKRIEKMLATRGGTNFSSVAQALKQWVDSTPDFKSQRIEQINQYPVWLVISDGDINSHGDAARSMMDFKSKMLQWFGWDGVVVIWDVKQQESSSASKFENIENIVYFGGFNEGILNQVFCNINDIDIVDVYLPLVALHRSNRYEPVRELLAETKSVEQETLIAE